MVFRELGADITVINASPDGRNINLNAGLTHPESLAGGRRRQWADFGVAYDDATVAPPSTTRASQPTGTRSWGFWQLNARPGALAKDTLVVTVMSNLGLLAMRGGSRRSDGCG